MRKNVIFALILFSFFSVLRAGDSDSDSDKLSKQYMNSYIAYFNNEKDVFVMGMPVLTLDKNRDNVTVLPSVMSSLKKGFAYINLNGYQGGVVFPSSSRKWMYQIFYTIENDSYYLELSELSFFKELLSPSALSAKSNLPKMQSLIGTGVSYSFSDNLSGGINFAYSWADSSRKKTVTDKKTEEDSYSANKIQLNPSVSLKTRAYTIDVGGIFSRQWIDLTLKNVDEKPMNDYSGNNSFSIYSRFLKNMTDYSKLSLGVSLKYIPVSYKNKNENSEKSTDTFDNDNFDLSLKAGLIIKPVSSLKISSYATYIYSDFSYKVSSKLGNTEESSRSYHFLILGSFATFSPAKHFYFKSGIAKKIIYLSRQSKDTGEYFSSETTRTATFDEPLLSYYFGIGYKYKNFKAETIINSDVFEKGNYVVSGRFLETSPVLLATLEYSW